MIARCLDSSCDKLLKQLLQLQLLQNSPLAKHSQYNFKHWDLVQLHGLRGLTPVDSNMSGVFSAFDASIAAVGVNGNGKAAGSILVIGWSGGIVTTYFEMEQTSYVYYFILNYLIWDILFWWGFAKSLRQLLSHFRMVGLFSVD